MTDNLLALDVASNTGVCWGIPGLAPQFMSQKFTRDGESSSMDGVASAASRAMLWLIEFLKVEKIEAAVIEAPIPERALGAHSNAWSTALKYALIGSLSGVLRGKSIPIRFANIQGIRKNFLGHGNLPGEVAKKETMRFCIAAGWSPKNLDESDAGAAWHFECMKRFPRESQLIDPIALRIPPVQKPIKGERVSLAPKRFGGQMS